MCVHQGPGSTGSGVRIWSKNLVWYRGGPNLKDACQVAAGNFIPEPPSASALIPSFPFVPMKPPPPPHECDLAPVLNLLTLSESPLPTPPPASASAVWGG